MQIIFGTENINIARRHIENGNWQALKDNIEKVLKEVEKGMIMICDPLMYDGEPKVAMGDNWYDEHPIITTGESAREFREYVTSILT